MLRLENALILIIMSSLGWTTEATINVIIEDNIEEG